MGRAVRNVTGVKWVPRHDVWLGSTADRDPRAKHAGRPVDCSDVRGPRAARTCDRGLFREKDIIRDRTNVPAYISLAVAYQVSNLQILEGLRLA